MENKPIKILVVEDNKADLRLLEEFLSEAPDRNRAFELTGAGTLVRALELLSATAYDIILLDLFLPDSSGMDTLGVVNDRAPDTPIVVLTGLQDEFVAANAVHIGAQDYLVKKLISNESLWRVINYSIERKQAEARLRALEERYRTLIEALDDAIVVLDTDMNIVVSNAAFKAVSRAGSAAPAVTGRKLPETTLPPKAIELCKQVFAGGGILTAEVPHLWKNKQSVLEIKVTPVAGGGGVQRVIIVARDITERKQLEQIKDDFASLVSHELRSPLTTVVAGLEMVLAGGCGGLGEIEKKLLSAAYGDAQRINRIVTKLLEISRVESGKSSAKKDEADIVQLAKETVARFAPTARNRNIELRGKYSAESIKAMVDMDGITEVFINLITNALKFTEKGFIEISVLDKGETVECAVTDTGIGISHENQPDLFSKFKQFDRPVVGQEKGNGLGLFLVKEIIRRHKGVLSVTSEPGKGSSFSFTLPKIGESELLLLTR